MYYDVIGGQEPEEVAELIGQPIREFLKVLIFKARTIPYPFAVNNQSILA